MICAIVFSACSTASLFGTSDERAQKKAERKEVLKQEQEQERQLPSPKAEQHRRVLDPKATRTMPRPVYNK